MDTGRVPLYKDMGSLQRKGNSSQRDLRRLRGGGVDV